MEFRNRAGLASQKREARRILGLDALGGYHSTRIRS